MKNRRLEFIRTFRFNSIFMKTLLILFALLVFSMTVFYFFANRLISESLREKTYSSNLNMLNNTSNSIDYTLNSIIRSMRQTFQNQYIISAMIVPDINNYQRAVNIVNQLNNVKKSNNLIREAMLYIPTDNTLFAANGTIVSLDDFYDKGIINVYNKNLYMGDILVNDNITTEIKKIDGRIILYQEFFPTHLKKIGTLVFELNTDVFYQIIGGNMNYLENNIFVFDEHNNPILTRQIDYSRLNIKSSNMLKFEGKGGSFSGKELTGDQNIYFYYQSDLSKWKYVYPVTSSSLKFSFDITLGVVLPFLLLLFTAGALLSLYITFSIYKPINKLILSVSPAGSKTPQINGKTPKNELDFFSLAYGNAVSKNDQLSTALESITPAVQERLFMNLLYGREITLDAVRDTLDSIGRPYDMDARYLVLNIAVVQPETRGISEVEMNLYIMGISNVIRNQMDNRVKFCMVRTGDTAVALILAFACDASVMQIKQAVVSLCRDITGKAHGLRYHVVFGRGNIYNNIMDIRYSYLEAQEDLNYHLYLGDSDTDESSEEILKDDKLYNNSFFNERLKSILQKINDSSCQHAIELMKSMTGEISESIQDPAYARKVFETFIDCMIEKMIEMKIKTNEHIFAERKEMDKHFDSFVSVRQMEHYTQMLCTEAIELIDVYNKKRQHKYIVGAKEYLENNYSNSSLSLNITAEYIGINPSYLSKLFNESLNMHFVDYLNELRVEKAKQLLDATDLAIKEIGYKTGFNSMQNFFRVFKKYENMSPGKYRSKS